MKNIKVFILAIVFFLGAKTVDAQIDSVGVSMNAGVPKRVVNVQGTYFISGESYNFSDEDRTEYVFSWNFDEITYADTTPAMQFVFQELGEHTITFYAEDLSSGIIEQKAINLALGASAEVPNVFSPNGDGINDIFIIPADGFTVYQISIFTRSGMVVFEKEAPVITWDGRNKAGDEVKQGIYFYVLKALNGTSPPKKGFLHLFR
jgi:gliding motility-associated-like protein